MKQNMINFINRHQKFVTHKMTLLQTLHQNPATLALLHCCKLFCTKKNIFIILNEGR
jgi:hypothetical protein